MAAMSEPECHFSPCVAGLLSGRGVIFRALCVSVWGWAHEDQKHLWLFALLF